MEKEKCLAYEAPQVEIIEVEVEKGFAVTGGINNDPIQTGEIW